MIKFSGHLFRNVPNSLKDNVHENKTYPIFKKDNVHEYKTYPIFLAELLQRSPVLVRDPEPLGVTRTDVHVHLVANSNLGIEKILDFKSLILMVFCLPLQSCCSPGGRVCEPLEPGKLKLKVVVKVIVTRCASHWRVKVLFFV